MNMERKSRIRQAVQAAFADQLRFQKSQSEKAAALEPDLHLLYSPESFSTAEKMQRSINVLNQCLAIDTGTMSELQRGPDSLQASLQQYHLTQTEEREVIKTFSEGFFDSDLAKAEQQALAAESAWVDATSELYRFSLLHASQIAVESGRVVIASPPTMKEFDQKLARSNSLHVDFVAAFQREQKLSAEERAKAGVPPDDSASEK